MKYRLININLLVIIAVLLVGGCATSINSLNDKTSFAGFRSEDKIAAAIIDKSSLLWVRTTVDENYQSADRPSPEDLQPAAASQYNLIYHLYGPDYRYPYGNRIWSQHRRRHSSLFWDYGYGYDPFYDPYYQDPFWGVHYRQSWGYNSWTDPYFDFMFYDPFAYSNYYSYPFEPVYWGHRRYYTTRSGTTYASSTTKKSKQRRVRGRGDARHVKKPSSTSTAASAGQSNVRVGNTTTTNASGTRVKRSGSSSSSSKSSGTKSTSTKKQRRQRGRDD